MDRAEGRWIVQDPERLYELETERRDFGGPVMLY